MTLAPERREKVETHYFPDTQSALDGLPSKTMLLGYVVNRLAVSIDEFPDPALSNKDGIANTSAVDLVGASERAFGRQRVQVNRALRSAEKLSARSSSKARAEFRVQTPAKTSMPPDSKEKELKASTTVEEGLERSTTMKACENIDWDIILHIDSDPDPENTETIGFRHVEITNGIITGNVEDEGGEFLSVLRGTCTPSVVAGQPDMSQMNFVFTLRDNEEELFLLLLDGIAYPNPNTGRGEFHGQFRAYVPFGDTLLSPLINPASPGPPPGHLEHLDFDEGDTGTGNGTQT